MADKMIKYFNIMARIIRMLIENNEYNDKDFQSVLYDYSSKEYSWDLMSQNN